MRSVELRCKGWHTVEDSSLSLRMLTCALQRTAINEVKYDAYDLSVRILLRAKYFDETYCVAILVDLDRVYKEFEIARVHIVL